LETPNYALNIFVKFAPTEPIRKVATLHIQNRYDTSKEQNWKPDYAQIMLAIIAINCLLIGVDYGNIIENVLYKFLIIPQILYKIQTPNSSQN
jgi:hypothetical protein